MVLSVPRLTAAAVSCVGDCGGHGAVTLGDLVTMVNIALDPAKLTDCEAGDANGDKSIEVDELITAASNALRGCPALHIGSVAGPAGSVVQLTVTLNTASWEVLGTDNEIAFQPDARVAAKPSGVPDCTVNPAIQKGGTFFLFKPTNCSGDACQSVEAFVTTQFLGTVVPIPTGAQLYTCNVSIAPNAVASVPLTCTNAEASAAYLSGKSQLLTTSCADGVVTVVAP